MSDRATLVANAIVSIIRAQLRQGKAANLAAIRAEIAEILREELHDERRQARDEIKPPD